VVVDTSHFRGNFPESCSIEGAALDADPPAEAVGAGDPRFRELLPVSPLEGHARNRFPIALGRRVSHLLLRIHPDGGVARLRVHGEVVPDWSRHAPGAEVDLAAVEHGGRVLEASDMFFGHRHHLVYPGPPLGMFDGWETRRRRGPGHDWAVLELGAPGRLRRIEVDTSYFKGNAPGSCSLEGATTESWRSGEPVWREILTRRPLAPDERHAFVDLPAHEPVGHVRLNIFPDGGVARLRVFGVREPGA
jgi:allantoicase